MTPSGETKMEQSLNSCVLGEAANESDVVIHASNDERSSSPS